MTGGFSKSLIALPSRRNSGFTQTPMVVPTFRPLASSRIGMRRETSTPGSSVLRTATTWYSVRPLNAPPISCITFSR